MTNSEDPDQMLHSTLGLFVSILRVIMILLYFIFSYFSISNNSKTSVTQTIDQDKNGYQVNIFLISLWKHMLRVLIRSALYVFEEK